MSPIFLDRIRERVRTSTAHQFFMKELRKGPGIANKDKYWVVL